MSAARERVRVKVTLLNGGYCHQLQRLVDGRTWRLTRFHAVFLVIEHPDRGVYLVDTGYSDRFKAATRPWPRRLYRWVTPVHATENTADLLQRAGFPPPSIQGIIVSHFHADHIGGLKDFPAVPVVRSEGALEEWQARSAFGQTLSGFLPDLLPPDLPGRTRILTRREFAPDPALAGLLTHDLLGDGSVQLVSLPGHAPGQLGVVLETEQERVFYAADAYWHFRQLTAAVEPAPPARLFIHDMKAYRATVATLRGLWAEGSVTLFACHCPQTQAQVTPRGHCK